MVNWSLPNFNSTYASLNGVFQYGNLVSDNLFGVSIFLIYTIVLIVNSILKNNSVKQGVTEGGFIAWVLTLLLGVAEGTIIPGEIAGLFTLVYISWIGYLIYENYR